MERCWGRTCEVQNGEVEVSSIERVLTPLVPRDKLGTLDSAATVLLFVPYHCHSPSKTRAIFLIALKFHGDDNDFMEDMMLHASSSFLIVCLLPYLYQGFLTLISV